MTRGVPAAARSSLSWAAATDIGQRPRNEDAYAGAACQDQGRSSRGFFVVCDGMGGHAGGEEASELAVSVLRDELAWVLDADWPSAEAIEERTRQAVAAANHAVFAMNERSATIGRDRAGTTLAMLLVGNNGEAYVGHIGDSRVYLVTERDAVLLTLDHTVANREIRQGTLPEVARQRADARHLTQALGPFPDEYVQLELRSCPVVEPALFVLCSDGVSEADLVEHEAARLLRPLLAPGADLEAGCQALIAAARRAWGHDNMTAILVRVDPDA